MLVPMMFFFLALIVVGGIGSVLTVADPHAGRNAPFAFAALFAGLGVYGFVSAMYFAGGLFAPSISDFIAFFVGVPVGSVGGAVLGYHLGLKQRRRAETRLNYEQEEAERNL